MYGGSTSSYPRHEALRAWLRDAQACTSLLAPADVVVSVGSQGERHFAAHRAVLAAHSGYLKAALLGSPPALALPNLSAEAFAPLLAFMYSGYLELSHDNIYSILLAAHLLHMPRALDHCRAFLVHNHPAPPLVSLEDPAVSRNSPPLPTLIKPIPSKAPIPGSSWSAALQPSAPPLCLLPSQTSLFRAVRQEEENPPSSDDEEISVTDDMPAPPANSSESPPPQQVDSPESSKRVVLDVACCDGPVRFHRVLNANYGLALDADIEPDDAEEDERRHREERKPGDAEGGATMTYKCLYCNHAFKSHYCYQKHARRHINPVTLDLAKLADRLRAELAAREVKLLDMNVQYYPCKTCGCKFPSYYFVHKHRRMCHPGEVEQEQQAAAAASGTKSPSAGPSSQQDNSSE
ncbi:hypothetical protein B566_EDAN015996 [Ephemera danica]|nr:hypothetical protein B566_EDAN015996 [Ephemera danica]